MTDDVKNAIGGHIKCAIRELGQAEQTFVSNPQFAIDRIGEARMCLAAARVAIANNPTPLVRLNAGRKVA